MSRGRTRSTARSTCTWTSTVRLRSTHARQKPHVLTCLCTRSAECHAFPDDAYVTDQLLVGLICVAVALPVDVFITRAFETANEVDLPGNWLDEPPGTWKLLLGKRAHNGWRLADPEKPVSALVLWLVGGGSESYLETLLFFLGYAARRLRAALCRCGVSFAPEEQAVKYSGAHPSMPLDILDYVSANGRGGGSMLDSSCSASEASSSDSGYARAEALQKRLYASAGLLGVYAMWVLFSWVIFVRASRTCSTCARALTRLRLRDRRTAC